MSQQNRDSTSPGVGSSSPRRRWLREPLFRAGTAAIALAICLPALIPREQKVSIRLLPRANETIRFRMTQEMDFDITAQDSDPSESPANPTTTKVLGKTVFAFTEKTGTLDRQHRLPVEVTYDQISIERTVNGVTSPGEGLGGDLVGRKVMMTYDRNGKIVDVKVPAGLALSAETLKETMAGLLVNLPQTPLAVGEQARMPFSAPLPVPTPAGDDLKMAGEMRYTLVSVTRDGNDRIARYDQTVEAKLVTTAELALPSGPGKVHISFTLVGAGGLQLNIDKGVVRSGEVQSTIDGSMYMTPAGSELKLHTLTLHGTTRTSAVEVR